LAARRATGSCPIRCGYCIIGKPSPNGRNGCRIIAPSRSGFQCPIDSAASRVCHATNAGGHLCSKNCRSEGSRGFKLDSRYFRVARGQRLRSGPWLLRWPAPADLQKTPAWRSWRAGRWLPRVPLTGDGECDEQAPHTEQTVPRARDGKHLSDDPQALCGRCNLVAFCWYILREPANIASDWNPIESRPMSSF
jgi:hypothetical protein